MEMGGVGEVRGGEMDGGVEPEVWVGRRRKKGWTVLIKGFFGFL